MREFICDMQMSICEEAIAPFMKYNETTDKRLALIGITDDNGELYYLSLEILAASFASGFSDSYDEYIADYFGGIHNENYMAADSALYAVEHLIDKNEIIGAYIYLIICCGLINYQVPKELFWIARKDGALSVYMKKFMEVMKNIEAQHSEDECLECCFPNKRTGEGD